MTATTLNPSAPTIDQPPDDSPAALTPAAALDLPGQPILPWEWLWLTVITLIGAAFRAVNLTARPLWSDELTTIITATRDLAASFTTSQDPQPPLYQLLVRLLAGGGEPSDLIVRLPACLFGIATIPAAWWAARTFLDRFGAAVAVLLIALNPMLIHHARDARPYALFVFFATLSITFFYRVVKTGGRGNVAGYVIATAGMFLSHYYAMFFLAAQVCYAGLDAIFAGPTRRRRWTVLLALALATLAASPVLYLFLRLILGGMEGSWWISKPSSPIEGFDALGDILGIRALGVLCAIPLLAAFWLPHAPPWLHHRLHKHPAPTGGDARRGPADVPCAPFWFPWWLRQERAIYLALCIGFALFLPLIGSILVKPGWVLRYSLPVVVPMTIVGIAYLRAAGPTIAAIVLLLLIAFTAPKGLRAMKGEPGLREAVAKVIAQKGTDDAVLLPDWNFARDFQHPDVVGLKRYGFVGEPLFARVRVIEGASAAQTWLKERRSADYITSKLGERKLTPEELAQAMHTPDSILPRQKTWAICFLSTVKPLRQHLIDRGRRFSEYEFGLYDDKRQPMYTLLEIEAR